MSKPLDRITLLETFVRIADMGNISAAARDIGLSQPSASRQLSELESRLKTQLIRRNTHSLALTDAGIDLLADARRLLDSWEVLEERHLAGETEIQGKLKIVAPIALGQIHLARIAWTFQRDHPSVMITWQLEDQPIRFTEVGCDCWIKIGPIPDETLIVRQLGTVQRSLVASREFVGKYGLPSAPKKAETLPLVSLEPFEGGQIPLHQKETEIKIQPDVRLQTNNIFALKEAVSMGLGMAVLPKWFISEELSKGEMVDLLPKWAAPSLNINVAYLPGKHRTLRLKTFLETIKEAIPDIPGIDGNT